MSMTITPSLSEDDRSAILDAVRDFSRTRLEPFSLERDQTGTFPRDLFPCAGELGLGGLYVREDVGGAALARTDAIAVVEELAKGDPTMRFRLRLPPSRRYRKPPRLSHEHAHTPCARDGLKPN
ncbi:acyl-CoA dehydrogenase family protein [Microbacterium sp.]|uniref:acyl-CoA dehydrogenase family protein n=1 Tax=Microbacterium sp. TaxID=51671 RepID=UPI0039E580F6